MASGGTSPCPCGSGRKYKRCCLTTVSAIGGAYTPAERQSALAMLTEFVDRREFDEARDEASGRFWDAANELLADAEIPVVEEQGAAWFDEWFAMDCLLPSGRTAVEELLLRKGERLRPGDHRYLAGIRESHLRPYEVIRVRPDEGLDLHDLWADRPIDVRERLATR